LRDTSLVRHVAQGRLYHVQHTSCGYPLANASSCHGCCATTLLTRLLLSRAARMRGSSQDPDSASRNRFPGSTGPCFPAERADQGRDAPSPSPPIHDASAGAQLAIGSLNIGSGAPSMSRPHSVRILAVYHVPNRILTMCHSALVCRARGPKQGQPGSSSAQFLWDGLGRF